MASAGRLSSSWTLTLSVSIHYIVGFANCSLQVHFTTIDIVRFKKVRAGRAPDSKEEGRAREPAVSPVTIWIGVSPKSTSTAAAHGAAQGILALLKNHQITDIDIDFRESSYRCKAGPQLLEPADESDPLADFISPLTPALSLCISTKARPNIEGTMALYLAEGGQSDRLLGLSCRHVLIKEAETETDTEHTHGPSGDDVILLGDGALTKLTSSISEKIQQHPKVVEHLEKRIKWLMEREGGPDANDVEKAKGPRIKTQASLNEEKNTQKALQALLDQVNRDWNELDNRILGPILCSPTIGFCVGEHQFTEDWAIFEVNRAKLGKSFQGNKIDLGVFQLSD